MVEWSDSERSTIASVWGKINVDEIGPQALARVLIVYPLTQRYLGAFGNLSSAAAILGNPKVSEHGRTVLNALDKAVKNLDNIKDNFRVHATSLFSKFELGRAETFGGVGAQSIKGAYGIRLEIALCSLLIRVSKRMLL
uniref:Hemoglobin, beta adult 2 n=1 Tax=Cyprinus carpio TaxID=7962 RepID=A0A8C1X5R8_CYPCA